MNFPLFSTFSLLLLSTCASRLDFTDDGGNSICPNNPTLCSGTCCGARCTETEIDPDNCGRCNYVCGEGQLCRGGRCGCGATGAPCARTQTCCNFNGCKDLDNDINNCGACDHVCPGTGTSCASGKCLCGEGPSAKTCTTDEVCCQGTCKPAGQCVKNPDMATGEKPLCQCLDHCRASSGGECIPRVTGLCIGPSCCAKDLNCFPSSSCKAQTYEDAVCR